jgi:hypothetical protein
MVDYSAPARREMSKVNATNLQLTLLEIDHPDLTTPVRVVNDRADIVFETNTYTALGFRIALPSDLQKGLPRASLSVDNVGKELVTWLEDSNGGKGTTVRILQVLRTDTSTAEVDITMTLFNIEVTSAAVTGQLGFEDILNIPAVTLIYSPEVAPGLY